MSISNCSGNWSQKTIDNCTQESRVYHRRQEQLGSVVKFLNEEKTQLLTNFHPLFRSKLNEIFKQDSHLLTLANRLIEQIGVVDQHSLDSLTRAFQEKSSLHKGMSLLNAIYLHVEELKKGGSNNSLEAKTTAYLEELQKNHPSLCASLQSKEIKELTQESTPLVEACKTCWQQIHEMPKPLSEVERALSDSKDADVVIVGGGPIGLWTAIQTKLLTGKKITVLEKYQEYQRADIRLNIDASSLKGTPDDPVLKELVKKWGGRSVPIKEMEESLAKRAHELGVRVIRGYPVEPKSLPSHFPEAKVFIGADGARSVTRQTIFNDEFRFNTTQQYLIQLQYTIKERVDELDEDTSFRKVKVLRDNYIKQRFAKHVILQNSRMQSDGSSKVTLRVFVDKETFDQMSGATFKSPYYFETDMDKIPPSLREVLIKWWGSQPEFADGMTMVGGKNSNKITAISLGSYAAKEAFKVDEEGRLWALTGDALAAFPFFRAINNGLLISTHLSKCVAEGFKNEEKTEFSSSFHSFSRYAFFRIWIERTKARIKSIFLSLSQLWLSSKIPKLPASVGSMQFKDSEEMLWNRGARIWERLLKQPAS